MFTENFFDFFPHRVEKRKMWNAQSINQSINQIVVVVVVIFCHDYNDDKVDGSVSIIYKMEKFLLKIIRHDKLSSFYCICVFKRLCL